MSLLSKLPIFGPVTFFGGASNFSNILAPRVSEYKSLMSRPELQLQWLSFNVFNVVLCSSLHITSEGREDKFPLIGYDYQLRDVEDLYIAGGASHGPDYRKSAGGFIHGFRYTGEGVTDRGNIQGTLHGLWSHTVIDICCCCRQAAKTVTGLRQQKAVAPLKNSLKNIPFKVAFYNMLV